MLKEEKENKVHSGTPGETDAEASFGNSIAQTMRGFNKYQKALAKMKITEILFKIECEPLTEDWLCEYW